VEEAKKAALKIRSNWDIGSDGIIDVISMLEEHGIKVIEINAPDSFDGLSTFINCSNPIIVLNKNMQPERIRFTALHELGHLIMRFKDGLGKREIENLCNTFANEMLIPETEFKSIVGDKRKYISYNELTYMQRQFGISCDALMHKAKDSNVISERYYRGFCIRKNRNPDYKKLIENSVYPKENSSRFERLVYQALSKDMISTSSAASLLNIPIDEVKRNASYQ
ncbi:MAG: ImmA/IrrE family metallo-endopeptidase, partial [Spirochaetales bacterium]|nr:ImmA/IrrE family metallo-endopeptidase [Spirochaetales bacterium]